MTIGKKLLVGAACVFGGVIVLSPLWLQLRGPASDQRAASALQRYVEEERGRDVKDVVCVSEHRTPGVYFCAFEYAGFHPVALPKHLCVRVRAGRAQPVAC